MKKLVLAVMIIGSATTTDSSNRTEISFKTKHIGIVVPTAYRSVPEQTDSSPFNTSTGERVRSGGVAVSRDLLCGACRKLRKRCARPDYPKRIHYEDWLYVNELGFLRVNDVMGAYTRQRVRGRIARIPLVRRIDVWVPTLADEKAFHKKYKSKSVELWEVKPMEN